MHGFTCPGRPAKPLRAADHRRRCGMRLQLQLNFRVWSDEQKAGNTPTVLLLSGQQDPRHHIQVRLEGEGWQPDTVSGRGAILRTAADNASFSVVVDGNQEVPADTWTLDFKACALAQEDT